VQNNGSKSEHMYLKNPNPILTIDSNGIPIFNRGESKTIVWIVPGDNKELQFDCRHVQIERDNIEEIHCVLKFINGKDLIGVERPVVFRIEFLPKQRIYLSRLYPKQCYPSFTGMDVLTFLMFLSNKTKFPITLMDVSDLSPVYYFLYGQSYYERMLDSKNPLRKEFSCTQNENYFLVENVFQKCIEAQLEKEKGVIKSMGIDIVQKFFFEDLELKFFPISEPVQKFFFQSLISKDCFPQQPIRKSMSYFMKPIIISDAKLNEIKNLKSVEKQSFVPPLVNTVNVEVLKNRIEDKTIFKQIILDSISFCWSKTAEGQTLNPEKLFFLIRDCIILKIDFSLKTSD